MEEVFKFISSLIEKEYSANLAYLAERDNTLFRQKELEYHKFWKDSDFADIFDRDDNPGEEWFEENKVTIEKGLHKRTLFQIKEYESDVYGKLYRCYLTSLSFSFIEYFENIFVASVDGELKIISVYSIKDDLESLPTSLSKWDYFVGEKIKKLGKPTTVFKNRAPENPMHLKEYEKE